jgi:hypothetical protein
MRIWKYQYTMQAHVSRNYYIPSNEIPHSFLLQQEFKIKYRRFGHMNGFSLLSGVTSQMTNNKTKRRWNPHIIFSIIYYPSLAIKMYSHFNAHNHIHIIKHWNPTSSNSRTGNSNLWDFIALMMEIASTSETLVNFYQTVWHYNPEDSHLQHTICLPRTSTPPCLTLHCTNNSLYSHNYS